MTREEAQGVAGFSDGVAACVRQLRAFADRPSVAAMTGPEALRLVAAVFEVAAAQAMPFEGGDGDGVA